jgi:large subunit ribosomal protein L21
MYAVIETSGRQYRVELGSEIELDHLDVEPGSSIELGRVLLVADGDDAHIGQPVVDGARVTGQVLRQDRGDKIIVFKYRPKARRRVKHGHRSELTVVRVSDIAFNGRSAADEAETQARKDAESRATAEKEAERKAAADQALADKLAADQAAAESAETAESEAEDKPKAKSSSSSKASSSKASKSKPSGAKADEKADAKADANSDQGADDAAPAGATGDEDDADEAPKAKPRAKKATAEKKDR